MEKREEGGRGDLNEMRWNQKRREQASQYHFLTCAPQSGLLRDVHKVIKRREEGGRRQRRPGGEKGKSKGERHIQPVIISLSVLHHLEHTKRFTELGREEKGEGGYRGDLVEKRESPKGEESSQASNLAPK